MIIYHSWNWLLFINSQHRLISFKISFIPILFTSHLHSFQNDLMNSKLLGINLHFVKKTFLLRLILAHFVLKSCQVAFYSYYSCFNLSSISVVVDHSEVKSCVFEHWYTSKHQDSSKIFFKPNWLVDWRQNVGDTVCKVYRNQDCCDCKTAPGWRLGRVDPKRAIGANYE